MKKNPKLFLKSFLGFLELYVKIWRFYVKISFIVLAPGGPTQLFEVPIPNEIKNKGLLPWSSG